MVGKYIALDEMVSGIITILLLVTLYVVLFMVYRKYEDDTLQVAAVVGSAMALLSTFLWGAQIITEEFIIYPILIMIGSILLFLIGRR